MCFQFSLPRVLLLVSIAKIAGQIFRIFNSDRHDRFKFSYMLLFIWTEYRTSSSSSFHPLPMPLPSHSARVLFFLSTPDQPAALFMSFHFFRCLIAIACTKRKEEYG
jgi:hypothetical protein